MTEIEKHYNKHREENRLATRHGKVEFAVAMKYIHDFLPAENRAEFKIADIGAGTGRYSVALAREGFDVTAVELVEHNLRILEAKHEHVKCWPGNAMNLGFLQDEFFDVTILFGPLYHLHQEKDKLKALNEAARITKKNGVIFTAYLLNDYSILSYCFAQDRISGLMESGKVSRDFHIHPDENELYDYVRLEDIDRLNQLSGLERLKIFSPDGPADFMRKELNAMSEETFNKFIEYQMCNAERREILGAGSHIVDVLKKR
ncbi:class I SAM-dependent methyltransferase [Treponema sp.]|uniref:class I SAM-dependent methyltransferase n=1 Tax=Treponema sp. TaxID=166 RepID=UPI003F015606